MEEAKKEGVITDEMLMVALARVEAPDCVVKADKAENLMKGDFGDPPWSIIIPSKLHFLEAEALQLLAGAPHALLEAHG